MSLCYVSFARTWKSRFLMNKRAGRLRIRSEMPVVGHAMPKTWAFQDTTASSRLRDELKSASRCKTASRQPTRLRVEGFGSQKKRTAITVPVQINSTIVCTNPRFPRPSAFQPAKEAVNDGLAVLFVDRSGEGNAHRAGLHAVLRVAAVCDAIFADNSL